MFEIIKAATLPAAKRKRIEPQTIEQRLVSLKENLANEADKESLYAQDLRLSIEVCEVAIYKAELSAT